MDPDSKPTFGFMQPTLGPGVGIGYGRMGKTPKRPKFVAYESREVLAENIKRRLANEFPHSTDRPEALAKRIGTSKSTIQRLINQEVGGTIDVISQIAMGLRCDPSDLLRPPGRE